MPSAELAIVGASICTRGADLGGLRSLDEVRGALAAERARCEDGIGGNAIDHSPEEPRDVPVRLTVVDGDVVSRE